MPEDDRNRRLVRSLGAFQDVVQRAGPAASAGYTLIGALLVLGGIGYAIDRWLGTRPWGTIVLFFLGVGAGMLSVYRAVTGIKMAVGSRPLAKADPAAQRAKDGWDDDEA